LDRASSPPHGSSCEELVSSTVKDIVAGPGIAFQERGERALDGAPGSLRLFAASP